jgi:hypothetical protein
VRVFRLPTMLKVACCKFKDSGRVCKKMVATVRLRCCQLRRALVFSCPGSFVVLRQGQGSSVAVHATIFVADDCKLRHTYRKDNGQYILTFILKRRLQPRHKSSHTALPGSRFTASMQRTALRKWPSSSSTRVAASSFSPGITILALRIRAW